jgi:hypothetical protein
MLDLWTPKILTTFDKHMTHMLKHWEYNLSFFLNKNLKFEHCEHTDINYSKLEEAHFASEMLLILALKNILVLVYFYRIQKVSHWKITCTIFFCCYFLALSTVILINYFERIILYESLLSSGNKHQIFS